MNNQKIAIIIQSVYGIIITLKTYLGSFQEGFIYLSLFIFLILISLKNDKTKKLSSKDLYLCYLISAILIITITFKIILFSANNFLLIKLKGESWNLDISYRYYMIGIISLSLPFFMYLHDKDN